MKCDLQANKEPSTKKKIDQFLADKKRLTNDLRSPIAQHYYDTFNSIDRFAQHLGYFQYPHKIIKKNMVILTNCLRMLCMNSRTIFLELSEQEMIEDTEENLKKFISTLVNQSSE